MKSRSGKHCFLGDCFLIFLEYFFKILVYVLERLHYLRVEMSRHGSSVSLRDYPASLNVSKGRLIRTPASQGVVLVNDIRYPSFKGDILSLKPFWIAAPV